MRTRLWTTASRRTECIRAMEMWWHRRFVIRIDRFLQIMWLIGQVAVCINTRYIIVAISSIFAQDQPRANRAILSEWKKNRYSLLFAANLIEIVFFIFVFQWRANIDSNTTLTMNEKNILKKIWNWNFDEKTQQSHNHTYLSACIWTIHRTIQAWSSRTQWKLKTFVVQSRNTHEMYQKNNGRIKKKEIISTEMKMDFKHLACPLEPWKQYWWMAIDCMTMTMTRCLYIVILQHSNQEQIMKTVLNITWNFIYIPSKVTLIHVELTCISLIALLLKRSHSVSVVFPLTTWPANAETPPFNTPPNSPDGHGPQRGCQTIIYMIFITW